MRKFLSDIKKDFIFTKASTSSTVAIFVNPNFYTVLLYRLSNLFFRYKLGIIAKMIWWVNRLVFTVDIHQGAKLSGGFMLVHGFGIVIGHEVRSTGRLKVYQNVTLGGSNNQTQSYQDMLLKQPLLKDNVTIYSGAVVVGPIIIEEDCIMGANATVTKNTKKNSIIIKYNEVISK